MEFLNIGFLLKSVENLMPLPNLPQKRRHELRPGLCTDDCLGVLLSSISKPEEEVEEDLPTVCAGFLTAK